MAAERLGLETVPVDYQDYASEADEWTDLLADNRIPEFAEIDKTLMKNLLKEIKNLDTDFDITLTGFEIEEINKILNEDFDLPNDEPQEAPELDYECFIEIYCNKIALNEIKHIIETWGKKHGAKVNIS